MASPAERTLITACFSLWASVAYRLLEDAPAISVWLAWWKDDRLAEREAGNAPFGRVLVEPDHPLQMHPANLTGELVQATVIRKAVGDLGQQIALLLGEVLLAERLDQAFGAGSV